MGKQTCVDPVAFSPSKWKYLLVRKSVQEEKSCNMALWLKFFFVNYRVYVAINHIFKQITPIDMSMQPCWVILDGNHVLLIPWSESLRHIACLYQLCKLFSPNNIYYYDYLTNYKLTLDLILPADLSHNYKICLSCFMYLYYLANQSSHSCD